MKFLNLNGYRFFRVTKPEELRLKLLELGRAHELCGSILLAEEGINLSISGPSERVEAFTPLLHEACGIEPISYKKSWSQKPPFKRFWVKVKKEIVTMGYPGLPLEKSAPHLSPQEFKSWLDEGRKMTLLDARKEFEYEMGHFRGAKSVGSIHFRDFPERLKTFEVDKETPIVTYCTGGIRCEKAAPYLKELGYKNVYQLDGGILRYFEECDGAYWDGECFVFDHRAALDPKLQIVNELTCRTCGECFERNFESDEDCGLNMQCRVCEDQARAS